MSAGWNMVICVHEKDSGWLVPRRNYDYGQHGEELIFYFKKMSRDILDISDRRMHKNAMLKNNNTRSCELDCLTTNGI